MWSCRAPTLRGDSTATNEEPNTRALQTTQAEGQPPALPSSSAHPLGRRLPSARARPSRRTSGCEAHLHSRAGYRSPRSRAAPAVIAAAPAVIAGPPRPRAPSPSASRITLALTARACAFGPEAHRYTGLAGNFSISPAPGLVAGDWMPGGRGIAQHRAGIRRHRARHDQHRAAPTRGRDAPTKCRSSHRGPTI